MTDAQRPDSQTTPRRGGRPRGSTQRPETRRKIAAALRGRTRDPEAVAKTAAATRARFADPEQRAKHSEAMRRSHARRAAEEDALALAPRAERIAQRAALVVRRARRNGQHTVSGVEAALLRQAVSEKLLPADLESLAYYLLEG